MRMRKAAVARWIVAGLFVAGAGAQAPPPPVDARLLGFELAPVGGIPGGWFGMPSGTIASDAADRHGGERSLRFERDATSGAELSFVTRGMPLDFAGRTIELRGWLKREGSARVSLWMRQDDAASGSVAFVDMGTNPAVSSQWGAHSISFAVNEKARSLIIGVRLVGPGKGWADDLELLVDGKPIAGAPKVARPKTVIETDAEFAAGSRISLASLNPRQLDALVLTAKVWGFLKYHHPAVTGGKQHWDFALFRQLPKLLASGSDADTQRLLVAWIDSLGPVRACSPCARTDSGWALKPRLAWIDDARLSGDLRARLKAIHANRGAEQFYVLLAPNVGNPVFENEPAYGGGSAPDAGFRILAVMRFWNMVEYWFPYRDLIDENWDGVLRDALPRIVAAQDLPAYHREMAALVTRADDGHATMNIGPAQPPGGECLAPVVLRPVEGKFVVKAVLEGAVGDIRAGDVVVALDGKPVEQIVREVRGYYGASNEASRLHRIAQSLTRGACGDLEVTLHRDAVLTVVTKRVAPEWPKLFAASLRDRPGETLQWLSPKVAYLKLSSIKQADVAKYLDDIAAADALIVDIRNYPSEFVVYALGTRLVAERTAFARFTNPVLANPGAFEWGLVVDLEPAKPRFNGRVAILVDESSVSQAEYTTMALRASPRALVVGSQTAAADGNVSPIPLPGGLRAAFSGIGVYYPDRTPTQQIGVKIDVPCRPTIAGIRAGRDELIDCALQAIAGD